MTLLCNDVDVMALEPTLYDESGLVGQRLCNRAAATLVGTQLTLADGSLQDAGIVPGMVATLNTTDNTTVGFWEITAVTGPATATVSTLRAHATDPAVAPTLAVGPIPVRLTVFSYGRQIASVSETLLASLGIGPDGPAYSDGVGLRAAAAFGAAAMLLTTLVSRGADTKTLGPKQDYYARAFAALKQGLRAKVDLDGDGVPDTYVSSGVRTLVRA